MLALVINSVLSLSIIMYSVDIMNHMDSSTPHDYRITWIGLALGAASNLIQPPELTWMHFMFLGAITYFVVQPKLKLWVHRYGQFHHYLPR